MTDQTMTSQSIPPQLDKPEQRQHQYPFKPCPGSGTVKQQVIASVSTFEEMNPSRRCSHEDCSLFYDAGTWGSPDPDMALLAVCDGHGGRDCVDYLEHGLVFHIAEELKAPGSSSPSSSSSEQETFTGTEARSGGGGGPHHEEEHRQDEVLVTTGSHHQKNEEGEVVIDDIPSRLERAFLMADIHSKCLGVQTSGATVALCLVKRHRDRPDDDEEDKKDVATTGTNNDNRDEDNGWANSKSLPTWTIHAANAGDARVVVGHQGFATRLTHDHRSDDPDEVERIERAGGFLFKGRVLGVLAVTRSLGDHCMKDYVIANPYCKSITISKQDEDEPTFILCACDGLFDVMSDQDAVDFVSDHLDETDTIAQLLVKEALRRGSTDNITATVAWL
mmetsp:Transcript_15472/g.38528  ORF Transcript_15472/g.38528 Transcript_15472/m.38528 type:complete len:390 (-) Transcript_15472:1468-2637(-)